MIRQLAVLSVMGSTAFFGAPSAVAQACRARHPGRCGKTSKPGGPSTESAVAQASASIPLGTFTCITGVSGSGKSTLTIDTHHFPMLSAPEAIARMLEEHAASAHARTPASDNVTPMRGHRVCPPSAANMFSLHKGRNL